MKRGKNCNFHNAFSFKLNVIVIEYIFMSCINDPHDKKAMQILEEYLPSVLNSTFFYFWEVVRINEPQMHRKQYKKFIPFTFYNKGKIILIIKRTHTIQICKRTKKNSCIVGSWMMLKLFLKESIHFIQSFVYNVNVFF